MYYSFSKKGKQNPRKKLSSFQDKAGTAAITSLRENAALLKVISSEEQARCCHWDSTHTVRFSSRSCASTELYLPLLVWTSYCNIRCILSPHHEVLLY